MQKHGQMNSYTLILVKTATSLFSHFVAPTFCIYIKKNKENEITKPSSRLNTAHR